MEVTLDLSQKLSKILQEVAAKDRMTVEEFIINELEYYYG